MTAVPEPLTERECHELLGAVSIGRVAFTDRALPAIQPVGFALLGAEVIIRTQEGSKLATAARDAVVAFEADEFDSSVGTGWTVVIVGHARVVAEDGELSLLRRLPLPTWAPGRRDRYIAIRPAMISGRRLPEGA